MKTIENMGKACKRCDGTGHITSWRGGLEPDAVYPCPRRCAATRRTVEVPYSSVKQALGAAANLARRLGYPAPNKARVQSVPDDEGTDRPIAVRAVLTRCGIELDSEDAQLLFEAAIRSDDEGSQDQWDELAEAAANDRELRDALQRGQAGRARLRALLELVSAELVVAGVVRKPPKLALYRVGYRVVRDAATGERSVQTVIDPSPHDRTVITGPRCLEAAHAIARGDVEDTEGRVVEQTVMVSKRRHPELAAELGPAWERGEFEYLVDLDATIAERLGCSAQHARKVRASWGIHGSRGAAPTRPPGIDDHCASMHHSGQGGDEDEC